MGGTRYEAGDGTIERARRLRRGATPAEMRFWAIVRDRRLGDAKFRRQQRFGPYTADFVCQSRRLIVEIDGDTHGTDKAQQHDRRRTAFLQGEGYRVLRFSNTDVLQNTDGVAASVLDALGPSPSHPAPPGRPLPLPRRGEGA